jgi:propanol-preferring alcohol dehydrogenase
MTELMIAARLHEINRQLRIDRLRVPSVSADEVLVRVRAAGICHSDINYLEGIGKVGKLPITLGHEIAGTIARRGSKVRGLGEGDRVLVHYVVSCGRCTFCRTQRENYCLNYRMIGKDMDGGFAEYVKVPARSIVKLPEPLPFTQAAIVGCAVSTAHHALKRARVKPGEAVAVFGVGGLGMHAIQLAKKIFKARLVIAVDVQDWKLKKARHFGATATVNAADRDTEEAIKRITDGEFADVAIDFVGRSSSMTQAVASVGKGGRVVIVGISRDNLQLSPYQTLIGKEMELIGVDDHLKGELTQLLQFIRTRKLDLSQSVTHTLPLEKINDGLQILKSGEGKPIRIVALT